MRIIDSERQKDYYDGVNAVGYDGSVLYVRNREEKEIKQRLNLNSFEIGNKRFYPSVIGFCGRTVPIIYCYEGGGYRFEGQDCGFGTKVVYYSYDSLNAKYSTNIGLWNKNNLKTFFDHYSSSSNDLMELFNNGKRPVWIVWQEWNKTKMVSNPLLKNYAFQSVEPPFQAHQSLHQYIANVAEDRKPIPTNTDEEKILTHGFNKFSFRKDPSKKK